MRVVIKTRLLDKTIMVKGREVPVFGLASLTVSPERKGIGSLALELFEDLAIQNDKYAVVAFTTKEVLPFYIKFGWSICGAFADRIAVSSVPLQTTFNEKW